MKPSNIGKTLRPKFCLLSVGNLTLRWLGKAKSREQIVVGFVLTTREAAIMFTVFRSMKFENEEA